MQKFCEVKLRLPPHLKEWLHRQAQADTRSMNGEVVVLLTKLMEADQQGKQ